MNQVVCTVVWLLSGVGCCNPIWTWYPFYLCLLRVHFQSIVYATSCFMLLLKVLGQHTLLLSQISGMVDILPWWPRFTLPPLQAKSQRACYAAEGHPDWTAVGVECEKGRHVTTEPHSRGPFHKAGSTTSESNPKRWVDLHWDRKLEFSVPEQRIWVNLINSE